MSKKKPVAPANTIVNCSSATSLLAASAPGMKWDPEVNKEYRMDIYEEKTEDVNSPFHLKDEITG